MNICDHGISPDRCPICKAVKPEPVNITNVPCLPQESVLVPQPDSSFTEILDPEAQNIEVLAHELALAKDSVSSIKKNIFDLKKQLSISEHGLIEAETEYKTKQSALLTAISGDK